MQDYMRQRAGEADMEDYLTLGRFELETGRGDQAFAAYQEAIAREEAETRIASRELADLLFDRGATSRAVTIYEDLHASDPSDTRVAARLAETQLRLQQPQPARATIQTLDDSPLKDTLLAMAFEQEGDAARALSLLDEAVAQNPNESVIYLRRAEMLARQATAEGPDATDTQKIERAMADLEQALRIDPEMSQARQLRAALSMQQADTRAAISELRDALEQQPENQQVRLQLLDLYLQTDDLSSARSLLDRMVQSEPDQLRWLAIRAEVSARQGRTGEELSDLRRLAERQPSPPNVLRLAKAQLDAGQAKAAIQSLAANAEMVKKEPLLAATLAIAQQAAGNPSQAQNTLVQALELCENLRQLATLIGQWPDDAPADLLNSAVRQATLDGPRWKEFAQAYAAVQTDRLQAGLDGLASLDGAGDLEPEMRARVDRLTALALYRAERFEEARAAYEKLLSENPRDVETLNNLAYLLADNLDLPAAALDLAERAAELAPENAQVLDTLGYCQYRADRLKAAQDTLQRSLRIQPLAPAALHLAQVERALGATARARLLLQRTVDLASGPADAEYREQAQALLTELDAAGG